MRRGTRQVLQVARFWADQLGVESEWVFPAARADNSEPVYSHQSLWHALRKAEKRAGLTKLAGRGAHGLRRMLAGDVWEETGDAKLAMDAIGDTDLRQMQNYLKDRPEKLKAAFDALDGGEPTPLIPNARKAPYRPRRQKAS